MGYEMMIDERGRLGGKNPMNMIDDVGVIPKQNN
jgi:hypothetical protein